MDGGHYISLSRPRELAERLGDLIGLDGRPAS
jgi:hypothetical protein